MGEKVKVVVVSKSIYGSVVDDKKYDHDSAAELIAWLQDRLADIPAEYRDSAKVEIESVGGYEGEHHAEITIYYSRPETQEEAAKRISEIKRSLAEDAKRHEHWAAEARRRLKETS